jgi:general secretion pathway protein M
LSADAAAMSSAASKLRDRALQRWHAFAPRERRALAAALVVLAGFVVWSLFVQPAWRTLRAAPAQLDQLEAELQGMQRLAAEAQELRAAAPVSATQAAAALQSATTRLGSSAKLTLQGERATLTLTATPPEALRGWLVEARSAARARPIEAQLTQATGGYSGSLIVSVEAAP